MKIKIDDLSILHRVYLSFAVLIGVLVAGSMLNYSNQNQLNSALVSVTEEASPIVLLANKLEVSLLSTNKRLTDVLSEKDPAQLTELTKELTSSRALFTASLDNFKHEAEKLPLLESYVPTLDKASKGYLADTANLAQQRAELLTLLRQTNKAKSEFQAIMPLFKQELGDMLAKIDDSYVQGVFRSMQAKQAPIEVTTFDALNQSSPALVSAALERNRKQIADYNKAVDDLKLELPSLENDIGLYIKSFILNTTQEKGLLARYLKLVETQVALEKQAKDASLQVMAVQAELSRVQQVAQDVMNKSIENANHTLATGRMQLLGTVLLAVAFAFGVAMQLLAASVHRCVS